MRFRPGVLFVVMAGFFLVGVYIYVLSTRARTAINPKAIETRTVPPVTTSPGIPKPGDVLAVELGSNLILEVVDAGGRPVEGARAFDAETYDAVLGRSDAEGIARLAIESLSLNWWGNAAVRVERDGYGPEVICIPAQTNRIRVALQPMARLAIRVVDYLNRPVAGATIRIHDPKEGIQSGPWESAEWLTDERGEARIPGLPPGALVARAWAPGLQEGYALTIVEPGETRDARIILRPGRSLIVFVRSTAGAPLAGSEVDFGFLNGGMSWGPERGFTFYGQVRKTDATGKATFDSLPPKLAMSWIRVNSPIHPTKEIDFEFEEPPPVVEVVVDQGARLIVDVLDPRGKSLSCSIHVQIPADPGYYNWTYPEKTAGSKAELTGLPADEPFNVRVYRHGAIMQEQLGVVLQPAETRELVLQVPELYEVDVAAKDPEPVPGRLTMKRLTEESVDVESRAPESTTYVADVGRKGSVRLTVKEGLYAATFQPFQGAPIALEVLVVRDTRVEFDVPVASAFKGTLVDPAGRPLAGWEVVWIAGEGRWKTVSGPDGTFAFKRITGGSGELWVGRLRFEAQAFAGAPSAAPSKVVVPLVSIRGTVLGPDGRGGRALLRLHPTDPDFEQVSKVGSNMKANAFVTGRDGSFHVQVPARRWRVIAYSEGGHSESAPVEVDAASVGAVIPIILPLQAK